MYGVRAWFGSASRGASSGALQRFCAPTLISARHGVRHDTPRSSAVHFLPTSIGSSLLTTAVAWTRTSDGPLTDVVGGTAGIVLAVIWAGGEHAETIAVTGGECLLRLAARTEGGLDWGLRPGEPSRLPNFSHGTAGVATALAIAGEALHRPDFIRAACRGAQHLLTLGLLDDGGFIIPHTIPPSRHPSTRPHPYIHAHRHHEGHLVMELYPTVTVHLVHERQRALAREATEARSRRVVRRNRAGRRRDGPAPG